MAHVAAPHLFDQLGLLAGLVSIVSALIIRFGLDRGVPITYSGAVMLMGIGMAFLHAEALVSLHLYIILYLRLMVIMGAFAIGPGALLWVLKNIDPDEGRPPQDQLEKSVERLEAAVISYLK